MLEKYMYFFFIGRKICGGDCKMISLLGSFKKFCLHTRVNRFYATIPRVSQQFIPIQYKAPNDATLISHILLIRAGFIRKV